MVTFLIIVTICCLDRQDPSELKLEYYGLGDAAGTSFNMKGKHVQFWSALITRTHKNLTSPGLLTLSSSNKTAATLSEVVQHLEQLYCDTMTIETAQIEVNVCSQIPCGKFTPRPLGSCSGCAFGFAWGHDHSMFSLVCRPNGGYGTLVSTLETIANFIVPSLTSITALYHVACRRAVSRRFITTQLNFYTPKQNTQPK